MNYTTLLSLIPNEKAAINFLVEKNIVQRPTCGQGHTMKLESKGGSNYRWSCNQCAYQQLADSFKGIRVDNWYHLHHASYLYYIFLGLPTQKLASQLLLNSSMHGHTNSRPTHIVLENWAYPIPRPVIGVSTCAILAPGPLQTPSKPKLEALVNLI